MGHPNPTAGKIWPLGLYLSITGPSLVKVQCHFEPGTESWHMLQNWGPVCLKLRHTNSSWLRYLILNSHFFCKTIADAKLLTKFSKSLMWHWSGFLWLLIKFRIWGCCNELCVVIVVPRSRLKATGDRGFEVVATKLKNLINLSSVLLDLWTPLKIFITLLSSVYYVCCLTFIVMDFVTSCSWKVLYKLHLVLHLLYFLFSSLTSLLFPPSTPPLLSSPLSGRYEASLPLSTSPSQFPTSVFLFPVISPFHSVCHKQADRRQTHSTLMDELLHSPSPLGSIALTGDRAAQHEQRARRRCPRG